jgi:hypothetical protein
MSGSKVQREIDVEATQPGLPPEVLHVTVPRTRDEAPACPACYAVLPKPAPDGRIDCACGATIYLVRR